ncbi:hypothetical protein RI367_006498 [Sorochytrium milnesiophthora]
MYQLNASQTTSILTLITVVLKEGIVVKPDIFTSLRIATLLNFTANIISLDLGDPSYSPCYVTMRWFICDLLWNLKDAARCWFICDKSLRLLGRNNWRVSAAVAGLSFGLYTGLMACAYTLTGDCTTPAARQQTGMGFRLALYAWWMMVELLMAWAIGSSMNMHYLRASKRLDLSWLTGILVQENTRLILSILVAVEIIISSVLMTQTQLGSFNSAVPLIDMNLSLYFLVMNLVVAPSARPNTATSGSHAGSRSDTKGTKGHLARATISATRHTQGDE